jgi:hypothetical protein
MATEGVVIDPATPGNVTWAQLWDETHTNKNVVYIKGAVNPDGTLKGRAYVTSRDYARTYRVPMLKDKQEFIERFYTNKQGLKIDSLKMQNEEVDSLPLMQEFDFAGNVESSGEYSHFSTNLFAGLGSNPFISDERIADVSFGTNQSYQIVTI